MSGCLDLYEIFESIQGESHLAGYPCTFIRLAGCNLGCRYCDTPEALEPGSGEQTSVVEVMQQVSAYGHRIVEITGGEPLLQNCVGTLAAFLIRDGYTLLLETNGSQDIGRFPRPSRIIMDVKGPSSGEEGSVLDGNIDHLLPGDEVKFVIATDADYRFALQFLAEHPLETLCRVSFSPAFGVPGSMSVAVLADRMVRDRLHVRLQPQLHRIIWGRDQAGR